jgi:hypothetical protein
MSQGPNNSDRDRNSPIASQLPAELEPPEGLEDRVVAELLSKNLLADVRSRPGSRNVVAPAVMTLAASLLVGFVAGRMTGQVPAGAAVLTGAEQDLYAVLLYETDGYDAAQGSELGARYGEYNQWVAEARRRGQFVAGQDLEVERGWLVRPTESLPEVEPATSISSEAPVSGIFFLRGEDPDRILDLARGLPHARHGGIVLVQKTVPTDAPPVPGPRK